MQRKKPKIKIQNVLGAIAIIVISTLGLLYLSITYNLPDGNSEGFKLNHGLIITAIITYEMDFGNYPKNLSDLNDYLDNVQLNNPTGASYELYVNQNGKLTLVSKYKKEVRTMVFD